jgi:hypothetical protein
MRRIATALQAVIGTFISIVTLPFRVLSHLIGRGSNRRPAQRSAGRPRRRAGRAF